MMVSSWKRQICLGLIMLLLLVAGGCNGKGSADEEAAGRPPVAVDVIQAARGTVDENVEVVGTLTPKNSADVRSEYVGVVKEVYVTEWVRVKKGDKLGLLDTREIESTVKKAEAAVKLAEANLLQAQVSASRANREHDRLAGLKRDGLATQQSLDEAFTERNAAAARVSAAQAQLHVAKQDFEYTKTRLEKALIVAPIDGVIAQRGLNVGDVVGEMGQSKGVTKIVDNRLLDLTVAVPSRYMAAVKVGQPLVFTSEAFSGRTFTGQVMYINPQVNEADRTVKIIAEVVNDPEVLKGGLFVKGRILTSQKEGVLLIPRTAIFNWDLVAGKGRVWLAVGQKTESRPVTTGAIKGDQVEIIDGLKPGDLVVIRGGFNLKDGDRLLLSESKG